MKTSAACLTASFLIQAVTGIASASTVIDFEDSSISNSPLGYSTEKVGGPRMPCMW
jgi:hypothetical protein